MSQNIQQNTMVVLLVGLVLGGVLGSLYTRVNMLENGSGSAKAADGQALGAADQPAAPTSLDVPEPDAKKDHWQGDAKARYVMIEYSDFQCPFCNRFAPTAKQLLESYDDMALVYRHFPLSFHEMARPLALGSECVAELGGNDAFWKFHDRVFEDMSNSKITVTADADKIAQEAGVDVEAYKKCRDDEKFAEKVDEQFNIGSAAGVAATPTTVVWDTKTGENVIIKGALPFESAKQIIDGLINK